MHFTSTFAAAIKFFFLLRALSGPSSVHAKLHPRQSRTVKQSVDTWQYKGCYIDGPGPRILTFRIDIPAGSSAETCTATCHANGYGLAGMEFGSECWCDNYKPYGNLTSESECNFACAGDSTEICGAGNRMTLYQDSSATPPDPNVCITWRDSFSFGNNIMMAVPKTDPSTRTKLFAVATNPFTDPVYYTIMSTCPPGCGFSDFFNFGVDKGVLTSFNTEPFAPVIGESQAFTSLPVQGYAGYCAKPNPNSPTGPFIGFPLLSASGHVDLWSLCPNISADGRLDIVFSPVENHPHYLKSACQDVNIEMTPLV